MKLYVSPVHREAIGEGSFTDTETGERVEVEYHTYVKPYRRAARGECSWWQWWGAKLRLVDLPLVPMVMVIPGDGRPRGVANANLLRKMGNP